MGVEWGGRDERPRKPKKGRYLGDDPAKGYASVGQMPGAPGINDADVFANAPWRAKPLNEQQFRGDQFDLDDPYEHDLAKHSEWLREMHEKHGHGGI